MNRLESTEQRSIWAAVGLICSLFRVNTGRAYISGMGPAGVNKLSDNSILMKAARPIAIGLADPMGNPVNGVSDLNGWTTIEITPEMVGQRVAVFTSVETKRTKGGRVSIEQQSWIDKVTAAGGFAFVANSAEVAREAITHMVTNRCAKLVDRKTPHN